MASPKITHKGYGGKPVEHPSNRGELVSDDCESSALSQAAPAPNLPPSSAEIVVRWRDIYKHRLTPLPKHLAPIPAKDMRATLEDLLEGSDADIERGFSNTDEFTRTAVSRAVLIYRRDNPGALPSPNRAIDIPGWIRESVRLTLESMKQKGRASTQELDVRLGAELIEAWSATGKRVTISNTSALVVWAQEMFTAVGRSINHDRVKSILSAAKTRNK